jgi:HK97 family phage major capsid protein
MTEKTIVNSRAELRSILQQAGFARAAADRIANGGWSALSKSPELDPEEDLKMSINALRERRAEKSAALHKLVAKATWSAEKDQPVYDALMGDINAIDTDIRRYQQSMEKIAGLAPIVAGAVQGNDDYSRAFTDFLRAPKNMQARQSLTDLEVMNAASGTTDPGGGFLIPEIILGPLMQKAVNVNPFRSLIRVVQVATRDVNFPLSNGNASTGWVGETAARTQTSEATLGNAKPTFGTLYSYVEASEELVMDSMFDIGAWFSIEAGLSMGVAEMASIIAGTGTNQPTGLLNTAPTTGADGSRAAGVLKYLPTGNAATLGSAPADLLITTLYDLKAAYRANATWVMNSAVAGEIRKLKDTQGRFLWADSLAPGEPATLLGFPVAIAESMAGVGANNFPIAFGDFSRAYILCENGPLRVTVDDNVTVPGRVKWYIRRRLGGIPYDNDAVRVIKVATT